MTNIAKDLEIDEDALDAIAAKAAEKVGMPDAEALGKTIDEHMEKTVESLLDKQMAKMEETQKKNLEQQEAAKQAELEKSDPVARGIAKSHFSQAQVDEKKEMRFFKAVKALVNGDDSAVRSYSALAKALAQKAGYANEGDVEDGGALVPDAEFNTTVYENLPKYGVAFANADVRQTDKTAVRVLTLDSGLEFYQTAEAGNKRGAKLQFSKQLRELLKYAVIVPATDELSDDAAIDFWNLVTKELSRAYAKKADEIVFTNATSGIIRTPGVLDEPVSGNGTTINWDDLLSGEGRLEDGMDNSGFKWYMRRETWFRLVQTKDLEGRYLFQPNPNTPTTPWGTPVVFTRVLPKSNEAGNNGAFAVFGDLSNYLLYSKRGMALFILREATVIDSEGEDFNLAVQDGTAMRAVVRMLGILPKGNVTKFVVLHSGTLS